MTHSTSTTITLPLGLARALMQAAYWPSIQADLHDAVGACNFADLAEERQDELDQWLAEIGRALAPNFGSEAMLHAVQRAWMGGKRPKVSFSKVG